MLESIIRSSVNYATGKTKNAEEYVIRLRKSIESEIRHQIKQHGGKNSFDVHTRYNLGFSDVDGFYQEIRTTVHCTQTTRETCAVARLPVPENNRLSNLRGIFHHASLKAKLANDYYFRGNEISNTEQTIQTELGLLFNNHKAIVVLNHSCTGNCAVDVELIECSNKNLSAMFAALENDCIEEPAV